MTCVHKVRWSVKRPEDCRFRLSVSHYKDRIVAPDEYSGATVVTPSDSEQVLATKDKTVRANITVNPAPTESFATNENGTFTPSSGNVGFSEVVVDVEPVLESLSVTENGLYLPESGTDGFDRVTVSVPEIIPDLVPLDVTENGQYLPTGHDGYSEVNVNVPTGGGSGLTLIDTINVNGVNGVQVDIDATWFDTYDYVVMVPDIIFSALDWPYLVQDATTGGDYGARVTAMGLHNSIVLNPLQGQLWFCWFREHNSRPLLGVVVSYLYWYLYGSNNTMTGTIKVYGIKVTA